MYSWPSERLSTFTTYGEGSNTIFIRKLFDCRESVAWKSQEHVIMRSFDALRLINKYMKVKILLHKN